MLAQCSPWDHSPSSVVITEQKVVITHIESSLGPPCVSSLLRSWPQMLADPLLPGHVNYSPAGPAPVSLVTTGFWPLHHWHGDPILVWDSSHSHGSWSCSCCCTWGCPHIQAESLSHRKRVFKWGLKWCLFRRQDRYHSWGTEHGQESIVSTNVFTLEQPLYPLIPLFSNVCSSLILANAFLSLPLATPLTTP